MHAPPNSFSPPAVIFVSLASIIFSSLPTFSSSSTRNGDKQSGWLRRRFACKKNITFSTSRFSFRDVRTIYNHFSDYSFPFIFFNAFPFPPVSLLFYAKKTVGQVKRREERNVFFLQYIGKRRL